MLNDHSLTCPECRQGQLLETDNDTLACLNCGARFTARRWACPFCAALNPLDAKDCQRCGQALRRVCPRCQTINPARAATCVACQLAFDTIGQIAAREELRYTDRFTRMAEGVSGMKAAEQAQSQQRMDQMWAAEHHRRATLAQQKHVQRQQEMRMIYAALILLALAGAAVIIVAILSHG